MPRRRAADRQSPVKKRTRTGCQTCRFRKIKCDEAKPECQNCLLRGLTCHNNLQLKWESDYAARGLSFGREGVWSKEPRGSFAGRPLEDREFKKLELPLVQSRHFINIFSHDFVGNSTSRIVHLPDTGSLLSEGFHAPNSFHIPHHHSSLIASTSHLSLDPRLNGLGNGLLEYYLLRLCPLTTPSYNASPFADQVAPLFASGGQDFFLLSVLAFAARHRCTTDSRWSRTAMTLKGKALAGFNQRLRSPTFMIDGISDPQVPAAMMFLCLDEIMESCDHQWVIHLRASREFMRKRRQLLPCGPSSKPGGLAAFAERFFAFLDLISRTACGNPPVFGIEYWQSLDHEKDVDAWMGCSPAMASLIFRITELAAASTRNDISPSQFVSDSLELEEELASLAAGTELSQVDDALRQCAELKKASVELYFQCLLRNANPSTPRVAALVHDILQSTHELVEKGCVAGLIFPIFVAAVQLDPLNDDNMFRHVTTGSSISGRRLVLETLRAMLGTSLANVERTKEVIVKVWRVRDLDANRDQSGGSEELNDWCTYVKPYSLNISLA